MDKYKQHLKKLWESWHGEHEDILEYLRLMWQIPKILEDENERVESSIQQTSATIQ